MEHVGYDVQGRKVARAAGKGGLAAAIASRDDPNFARTVYDALNDREVFFLNSYSYTQTKQQQKKQKLTLKVK